MIINAVIESKDGGTLVLDFPRSIYDVYEKLQSVGIRQSPHQITLSDEEGDDVRVKLYSEDETGKHLLLTLKEQNSLADANMLAFMVDNAKPDFRSKLEQNLLNDQYSSILCPEKVYACSISSSSKESSSALYPSENSSFRLSGDSQEIYSMATPSRMSTV